MGVAAESVEGFEGFTFEADGLCKAVYVAGTGRSVLLLHGLAGLTPGCLALAQRFARAGLRVYAPLLFGRPAQASKATGLAQAAVGGEIGLFASEGPSRLTDWLRPLCREVASRGGGEAIGAVGLGFTGSLVLSLLMEPCVGAAVTSHPSLPFGLVDASRSALGVPEEHAVNLRTRTDVRVLGWRFSQDPWCPAERFRRLSQLMGRRFDGREIPSGEETAFRPSSHAVLNYRRPLTPPIPDAVERTIRFVAARLAQAELQGGELSAPRPRAAAYRGP